MMPSDEERRVNLPAARKWVCSCTIVRELDGTVCICIDSLFCLYIYMDCFGKSCPTLTWPFAETGGRRERREKVVAGD